MNQYPHHREPVKAYIALGANLGHAQDTVLASIQSISELPHTEIIARSSLYRTAPIDSSGDDYINAVLKISTHSPAYTLLSLLQNIEQSAGRERPYVNAPRTLDLDLLLYGHATIQSEQLIVPHPRMWQRAFVLQPLHEIAPELVSAKDLASVADQRIEKLYQP
jgi:2-amino-4-hydroxy-6-hydroxymethyldihydropteridine diphosphokinase